jgi:hypothetical protein
MFSEQYGKRVTSLSVQEMFLSVRFDFAQREFKDKSGGTA